jgi:predicted hotdog family 3-hydroxylacyl-ACP dehydratase
MRISRDELTALIPHAGAMCLLDGVLEWNKDAIVCAATSHRDPGNPMRRNGLLHAVCGIEYVSQAMAVHGALANPSKARAQQGYLASVRNFVLHAARLDAIAGDLQVEARLVLNLGQKFLYSFTITGDQKTVIVGRAAVVLDGAAP